MKQPRLQTKILIFTAALVIAGASALSVVKSSHAQLTVQSITITPPNIKQALNPGDKTEGTLGVINDSDADLSFLTGVYDFIVTDNQGTPQILPVGTITNNKYSAASWIAADPVGFTVKAHQRYKLNYFIQIPKDATPGGHYAAIIYQPVGARGQAGTGASIQTQIASLVYITVNGPVNEYAKVTKFAAPSFKEYGPVDINTEIRNFGDLHVNPQGQITIKDLFGRTVATAPLANRNIFPGNIALDYKNTVGQQWMIGRFSANLLASYGSNNNLPLSATLYFWVFPWRAAVIIFLAIAAIILGLLLWKKNKKKHTTHEVVTATDEEPTQEIV